jgi:hypothetical protein
MKQVAIAILLVVSLMLNGCGGSSAQVQAASGAIWQAQLNGGSGSVSGLSFITTFTLNSDYTMNFSNFQFLNQGTCFPVEGEDPTGALTNVQVTQNTGAVIANFSFTVQGGGNTLVLTGTLTGTETGTEVGTTNTGTFTSAVATGTWTVSGSTCNLTAAETSFTMTLCTSSTVCPAS